MTSKPEAVESNQSCIAWFKLAELVSRKEREKALSLYRLLAHSFEDRAYVLQLEGDILCSLEDSLALEKYKQAAILYKKEAKLISAIGVYEHLLMLDSSNYEFISKLLLLYSLVDYQVKFEEHFVLLLEFLDKNIITQDFILTLCKKIFKENPEDSFLWIEKKLKRLLNNKPGLLAHVT